MDNFRNYTFKYEDYIFIKKYWNRHNMIYHEVGKNTLAIDRKYEDLLKEITIGRISISD